MTVLTVTADVGAGFKALRMVLFYWKFLLFLGGLVCRST